MWGASPNVEYEFNVRIHTHEYYIDKGEYGGCSRDSRIISYQDFTKHFKIPASGFKQTQRVVYSDGTVVYKNPNIVSFELAGEYSGAFHTAGRSRLCVKGSCEPFAEWVGE